MAQGAGPAQDEPTEEREPDGPLRLCAVTRAEHPIAELIRFAAAPDGTIVPDPAAKLPGRGVWITCDRNVVAQAVKTNAFAKSLKRQTKPAADLPEQVEKMFLARAQGALSMARKAGLVTTGFVQVGALIGTGEVAVLIHGSDAAAGGKEKLNRALAAVARAKGLKAQIFEPLTVDQMSLAIGRSNVVHAALKRGGASEKFVSEAGRLERYRLRSTASVDHPSPLENQV